MNRFPGFNLALCLSLWPLCLCGESSAADRRPLPEFERVVLDADFPGAYQVEVADINGDGRPDVVAVGGGTCAWYENPSWSKRVITTKDQTPGIISSAATDLDGDGKAEVAIAYEFAMNAPKKGKLTLAAQGPGPDDPWRLTPVADIGSIHRLRWGDVEGDRRPDLIVAPLFGPEARPPSFHQDPAQLIVFDTGADPKSGRWTALSAAQRPVMHAIDVSPPFDRSGRKSHVLTADYLGVALVWVLPRGKQSLVRPLIPGATGEAHERGSSEVHLGHLADGRRFLVTIDPWHGREVAVCLEAEPDSLKFGPREVIDATLDAGHALWVADVDRDGDDEVFAGHRGQDHRLSAYDLGADGHWTRTVLDRDVAAQDLRGGDLDGDGLPDIVAVGGATHNVLWFHPKPPDPAPDRSGGE